MELLDCFWVRISLDSWIRVRFAHRVQDNLRVWVGFQIRVGIGILVWIRVGFGFGLMFERWRWRRQRDGTEG